MSVCIDVERFASFKERVEFGDLTRLNKVLGFQRERVRLIVRQSNRRQDRVSCKSCVDGLLEGMLLSRMGLLYL